MRGMDGIRVCGGYRHLIHRDVKPSSLLIDVEGRVKVTVRALSCLSSSRSACLPRSDVERPHLHSMGTPACLVRTGLKQPEPCIQNPNPKPEEVLLACNPTVVQRR